MVTLRKMINGTDYTMEEREDGFIFTIREGDYERALVIGEITGASAERFFNVLVENEVLPGHLLPVAEDFEFATVKTITAR